MTEYEQYKANSHLYAKALMDRQLRLERMKVEEEQRQRLQQKLSDLLYLQGELTEYLQDIRVVLTTIDSVDRDFKSRRLAFVNGVVIFFSI